MTQEMIRICPNHGYFRGEKCSCGDSGRFVLSAFKAEKLGKIVSGALRHFPDKLELSVDKQGWASYDELVRVVQSRYYWAREYHIKALVESDGKGRYQVKEGRIRATYGHSIDVDLDFPTNDQPVLYYGTSEEEAEMVLETGLRPVKQRYVHLSSTIENAVTVANIHTDKPIIVTIDAKGAQENGVKIMRVGDICLSEPIPANFLSIRT